MYITLPSDASMDLFPDNTISAFTVKLPSELVVDRTRDVVGLASIEWPHTFQNATFGNLKIYLLPNESSGPPREKKVSATFNLVDGYYATSKELVTEINRALRYVHFTGYDHVLNGAQHCYLQYNERAETVAFVTEANSPAQFRLKMSWQLYATLGFALRRQGEPVIKTGEVAEYVVDLNAGFNSLYVYCDLVENSRIVGSKLTSVLRVLPIDGKHGEIRYYEPRHIEYLPLRYDRISEIRIELRTDTGELIHFKSGKTVVGLRIKSKVFDA